MSEMKHTPLPWRQGSPDEHCVKHDRSHPGPPQCKYTFQGWMEDEYFSRHVSSEATKQAVIGSDENGPMLSLANAKLIVTSVNARPKVEELVGAVNKLKGHLEETGEYRICRADKEQMGLPDQMTIGQVLCDIEDKAREVEAALGGKAE